MKRFIILITTLVSMCILASCGRFTSNTATEPSQPTTQEPDTTSDDTTTTSEDDELMNIILTLKIDNTIVDVFWADNESVTTLKKLANDGLTINLEMYGGNEQFGSLGVTLPSNDTNQTANAGNIMLYQSDKIVLFYCSNNWSYTKLGHINLSKSELTDLLGDGDVTITITLK
ncbi:MAG: cyclophilin-like fold protein [Candidatus Enterosoma sp.]|nr:cyclophilin-like fold protein [bacterium]MDY5866347.1 cyclophilin-like fold protein [Candidatus Enterosoma sp.]